MTMPEQAPLQRLQFYVTTGYSCGYLPNKLAQSLIAAPQHLVTAEVYSGLIQQGFRRSGKFAYRPHCEHCHECIPVRIIVDEFKPNRTQRKIFRQHQHLSTRIIPVEFKDEHFALYTAYQRARHSDSMKTDDADIDNAYQETEAEQYRNFLCQTNVDSVMVEFRDQQKLVMVSVIDLVRDGISAVYTFYDTYHHTTEIGQKRPSYGTYNILWQAEWCKSLNLPYLYLGYWIRDSAKMAYKQNFQPLQKLIDGEWVKSKS